MRKVTWQIGLLLLLCMALPLPIAAQGEGENTVQAVLFYSPTCPHCHAVINDLLIPMVEDYDGRLEILAFDVSQASGQQFYQATIVSFELPEERLGVPTLVVGEDVMVGAAEIPARFPTIVEEGLNGEGIPWPKIPGLAAALAQDPPEEDSGSDPAPTAQVEAAEQAEPTTVIESATEVKPPVEAEPSVELESPVEVEAPTRPATKVPEPTETIERAVIAQATVVSSPPAAEEGAIVLDSESGEVLKMEGEEPAADPLGFVIAGLILIAMVLGCGYAAWRIIVAWKNGFGVSALTVAYARNWAIPVLALAGLGVAAYLAYVEFTHVDAVCGPVGQCNIVQSSVYASILGVPVALLGLLTYVAILVLWLAQHYSGDRLGIWPTVGLMGLTIFGTLFSIYLTLLELFVIHAVCAWCLSSAVIMLILMLSVVVPATAKPDRTGLATG